MKFNGEYTTELTDHEQDIYDNCPATMPADRRLDYINSVRYVARNEPLFNSGRCEAERNHQHYLISLYY